MPFTEQFDVVVVGAGHAGCEVEPFSGREPEQCEGESPLAKSRAQSRDLAEQE